MRAAKYIDIFALNHFYDLIACRSQIFTGVELSRFFGENLADHRCRGQAVDTGFSYKFFNF